MKITMIAAMDPHRGIGLNGTMPWHCPEDLRHFKEMTMNKTLLMGRTTWDHLPCPLKGRRVIVMSSDPDFDGCEHFSSFEEAKHWIQRQDAQQELMIAGGASIYRQWIEFADEMILSRIPEVYPCDTFFPEWDENEWRCEQRIEKETFLLEIWKRISE